MKIDIELNIELLRKQYESLIKINEYNISAVERIATIEGLINMLEDILIQVDPPESEVICNRAVCTNTDPEYWNNSTRKYYCESCAIWINKENPEYKVIHKHDLCETQEARMIRLKHL